MLIATANCLNLFFFSILLTSFCRSCWIRHSSTRSLPSPFYHWFSMPVQRSKLNFIISCKRLSSGDYAVLYNSLYIHKCCCNINQRFSFSFGSSKRYKCPAWFSGKAKAYIRERIIFIDVTKILKQIISMIIFHFTKN